MGGLLRICTAGSVDDGKSTLIGRLLYDARAVYEDQVLSVTHASRNRGVGPIDFSLFTDGLRAEREQGITIDVAHRYFATPRRKFVLADTPGHEQYTRNMATGASTADVAIILVDARHGVGVQSRRHARIVRLLGIRHAVLAVNKMDLIDFDRETFESIGSEFAPLLDGAAVHAIPISALHGDNVITPSVSTPWFDGAPLLPHLESIQVDDNLRAAPFRFPVQLVLRPDAEFRGYAGQVLSGSIRAGDAVTVWPAGLPTTVKRIVTWDGDIEEAFAPMSVTLVLADEIDVSRGDVLARGRVDVGRTFEAQIVWMDERPLDPARPYLLKQGTTVVAAEVSRAFVLNEIGRATVVASRSLVFDPYERNRGTGSFILVDPATNFTAGAGMVLHRIGGGDGGDLSHGAAERLARAARGAASDAEAADAVRRVLEEILV